MSNFQAGITIPLLRAESYPHTWEVEINPDVDAANPDGLHLLVDVSKQTPGVVTLAASTRYDYVDAYGFEYDMTPSSARDLAVQLLLAAAQGDREMAEERPSPIGISDSGDA